MSSHRPVPSSQAFRSARSVLRSRSGRVAPPLRRAARSRTGGRRSKGLTLVIVVLLAIIFGVQELFADDASVPAHGDVVGGIVDQEAWNPQDAGPGYADELELLDEVPTSPRTPGDGYAREEFGARWADVDGNGCDTRNDMLARDLADSRLRDDGCTVQRGTLADPFTGEVIAFERGPDTSPAVQIDHLVALYDAWRTGARDWDPALRAQLANDPANLLAVDGPTNNAKSHADPSDWLPPDEAFHCDYVAARVRVKAAYGLWMTPAEHETSREVLTSCG